MPKASAAPAAAEAPAKPDPPEVKPEATSKETAKAEIAPRDTAEAKSEEAKPAETEETGPAVWEPKDQDVLSGRGASVNAHSGNKKFRALCFSRKPEFEAGNHAAKRRIATEIVTATANNGESRFLKKKVDKGPWHEMTFEQAILKACQVMRDYKRPDRLAIREMMQQNGSARKRSRQTESTPMLDTPVPTGPIEPIIENPFGVHDHDILSGRGAFVNGHVGNQRLRKLSLERKVQFDAGNYTEKRALATEVVQIIRSLEPPGRFLKRVSTPKKAAKEGNDWVLPPRGVDGEWEELNDDKAIHKACQVMRDIDRPDRKDRELRRAKKKQKGGKTPEKAKDSMTVLAETTAEKAAVEEAVAATEEALDKALGAATESKKGAEPVEV